MIAILPVIIGTKPSFWRTDRGKELIEETLKSLTRISRIKQIIIGSDEPEIISLAAPFVDCALLLCSEELHCDTTFLPPGTVDLRKALEDTKLTGTNNLAVIDFRSPKTAVKYIDRAISKYMENRSEMLISVRRIKDHPCQLKTPYKILDIGFLPHKATPDHESYPIISRQLESLKDYGINPNKYAISTFFAFSWPAALPVDLCRFYIEDMDSFEFNFSPLEEKKPAVPPKRIWFYESPTKARFLYDSSDFKSWVAPLYWSDRMEFISATDPNVFHTLLLRDTLSGEYHLHVNPKLFSAATYTLKIAIVKNDGTVSDNACELERPGLDKPFSFALKKREKPIGLIFQLYGIIETGHIDIWAQYEPKPALWEQNENSGLQINLGSGEPIHGRQNFPDAFEPDGAICITHRDNIIDNRMDDYIHQKGLDFIEISPNESIRIDSEFNYLRHTALFQANKKQSGQKKWTTS